MPLHAESHLGPNDFVAYLYTREHNVEGNYSPNSRQWAALRSLVENRGQNHFVESLDFGRGAYRFRFIIQERPDHVVVQGVFVEVDRSRVVRIMRSLRSDIEAGNYPKACSTVRQICNSSAFAIYVSGEAGYELHSVSGAAQGLPTIADIEQVLSSNTSHEGFCMSSPSEGEEAWVVPITMGGVKGFTVTCRCLESAISDECIQDLSDASFLFGQGLIASYAGFEIARSRAQLEVVYACANLLPGAIAVADENTGVVTFSNEAFNRLAGFDATGGSLADVPFANRHLMHDRASDVVFENGSYWRCSSMLSLHNDGLRRRQVIVQDVTETMNTQKRMLSTLEQGPSAIGRELHDGVCQEMTELIAISDGLAEDLENEGHAFADRADLLTRRAQGLVSGLRNIAHQLCPVSIKSGGIAEGLRGLKATLEEAGLIVTLDLCRDLDKINLTEEARLGVYRIVQEAVQNARKHGSAKRIIIEIKISEDLLVVRIGDDGSGLKGNGPGFGVQSMRTRAEIFGGEIELWNSGIGAVLEARLPLHTISYVEAPGAEEVATGLVDV